MKVSIGAVQFGLPYGISNPDGKTLTTEAYEILEVAYSNGINSIDTAYGYGNSEEIIGAYIQSHPEQTWKVISKLPRLKEHESIESDFDDYFYQSKQHLGNSLDAYLAHDAEQFISNQAIRSKFYSLKEQRQVNKIGVSIYSEREAKGIFELSDVDVIQLPLNILDHRLIKSGFLKKLQSKGIEIHVRSVFLQGLFFLTEDVLGDKFPDVLEPIRELKKIARTHAMELKDIALLFISSLPEIDLIIIGVNNFRQLESNIVSLNKNYGNEITQEILNKIDYCNENVLNPSLWAL